MSNDAVFILGLNSVLTGMITGAVIDMAVGAILIIVGYFWGRGGWW